MPHEIRTWWYIYMYIYIFIYIYSDIYIQFFFIYVMYLPFPGFLHRHWGNYIITTGPIAPSHYLNEYWLITNGFCGTHLRSFSQEVLEITIRKMILKNTIAKLRTHFSRASDINTILRNKCLKDISVTIDFSVSATNTQRIRLYPWWRHQMGTFSALLAICAGNSPVPGEFPLQRPVTRGFDVFFDLCLNKGLSKQSWGWCLRRHYTH